MTFTRLLVVCIALLLSHPLNAEGRASDDIRIENTFARAAIPGMHMSGAFMVIHNDGDTEHLLVDATSSAARHVELHAHIEEDGMMRMRRMAHFHLKPGQAKTLKPGGLHIMLMGLQEEMKEGSNITVELIFQDDSRTLITVPVKSISASQ